jgi:hypothetical protein
MLVLNEMLQLKHFCLIYSREMTRREASVAFWIAETKTPTKHISRNDRQNLFS